MNNNRGGGGGAAGGMIVIDAPAVTGGGGAKIFANGGSRGEGSGERAFHTAQRIREP
jgi:hypothetical protein